MIYWTQYFGNFFLKCATENYQIVLRFNNSWRSTFCKCRFFMKLWACFSFAYGAKNYYWVSEVGIRFEWVAFQFVRPSSQIQKRCTHVSFGFIVCGRNMDLCLAIDHGILNLQLLEWNRVLRLTFWQLLNLTLSTRHFTSLHFTIVVYRVNQFLQLCMLYGQISVLAKVKVGAKRLQ